MKTVHLQSKDLQSATPEMPNFVVWDWMSSGLHLKGTNLLIFAYLYSQSFDGAHACTTSLTTMSEWFGITRQTISKNIDMMPYVKKFVSQEHSSGNFYTFNHYKIDTEALSQHCIGLGGSVYESYMLSCKQILELKFPDDTKAIDDYFEDITEWHTNFTRDEANKIAAISRLGEVVGNESDNCIKEMFADAIAKVLKQLSPELMNTTIAENTVSKSTSIKQNSRTANKITVPATTRTRSNTSLLPPPKPKTKQKTKAEIRNENLKICSEYTTSFVAINYKGNQELERSLNNFLSVRISKGLSYEQWVVMLDKLMRETRGLDISEIVSLSDTAFVRNYMDIYYTPTNTSKRTKQSATVEEMYDIVDDYVTKYAEENDELRNVLYNYCEDVAFVNELTHNQVKQLLTNLNRIAPDISDKIICVQNAYAGGWRSFNVASNGNNRNSTASNSNAVAIDMDKKLDCIDKFISFSYWYETPNIKKLLVRYINETNAGKAMSLRQFKDALMYLRLHAPQSHDVERNVLEAITKNTTYLCREDFKDTAMAKKAYNSLEDRASNMERNRRASCEELKKKNPDNPLVANLELPKELDLSGWTKEIRTVADIDEFDAYRTKCIQEQKIDDYVCQYDRLRKYFEE